MLLWVQHSLFCYCQWAWLLFISPDKCSGHLLVKPSTLVEKSTWPITSRTSSRRIAQKMEVGTFLLPLNADINQGALKTWLTRLIPRGAQEPLCKVRQLGETEHVCIWLKTLLAVLQLYVFTDGCWHVLSGPIISKNTKVVSIVTKQELAVVYLKSITWITQTDNNLNNLV